LTRAATSASDGTYAIDGIQFQGRYIVTASRNGFATRTLENRPCAEIYLRPGNNSNEINFTLVEGVIVQGSVMTESRQAVPDAVLHCLGIAGSKGARFDEGHMTRTDASGNFALGFEEKDRGDVVSIRVRSAIGRDATFPSVIIQDEQPVQLKIAKSAIIRGVVKTNLGDPIAAARVGFFGLQDVPDPENGGILSGNPSFSGMFFAACDDEGRFAVEIDSGVTYDAEVEIEGSNGNRKREKISALSPGEERIYNPVIKTGSAVARIRVVGQPSGNPFKRHLPFYVLAMKDGEMVAQSEMGGSIEARITLPDEHAKYTFQAFYMSNPRVSGEVSDVYEVAAGKETTITLTLPDPQEFSLRAVDIAGNPVAGAEIGFTTETTGTFRSGQRTNDEGQLDAPIQMEPECGARLFLNKPGYATAWGALHDDQSPGTIHPEETLVLWPGAGFEGDAMDGAGHSLANTKLFITVVNQEGQSWPLEVSSDARGHFTIVDQAPADVVDIAIVAGDGAWSVDQLQLEANAISGLGEVVLE